MLDLSQGEKFIQPQTDTNASLSLTLKLQRL